MANKHQGDTSEISVDLNAADPDKAVTRRAASDIARDAKDDRSGDGRTKAEKELFKRMGRLERNLSKQFDQRMAEREAEWQRERSDLQAKLDKVAIDRDGDDKADAAHEAAIAALKAKLEASYEKGDSQESAAITLQISRLDAQYWAKKAKDAGVTTRETTDTTQRQTPTAQPKRSGPTVAGSRFIRANEDWWEDPEFKIERAAADAIYLDLVQNEGFDPKDAETFKEVAKKLNKKFPELKALAGGRRGPGDDDDGDDEDLEQGGRGEGDDRDTQRRRAPAANLQDRGGQGNRNDGDRRSLTAQDRKTMTDCRLDPDNDRDVVQFLREAQALERAQA